MENIIIEKIKAAVANHPDIDELHKIIEENKHTYCFFIKSKAELLDDYSFRLEETSARGVKIKGLELLVNNIRELEESNIRVNTFLTGELNYTAIYTDEYITTVYGVI